MATKCALIVDSNFVAHSSTGCIYFFGAAEYGGPWELVTKHTIVCADCTEEEGIY
jgi:hypothetical protein